MRRHEQSKSGLRKTLAISAALFGGLIGPFVVAAGFDRMGKAEVFVKAVYPDVFAHIRRYEIQFVDSDPTMTNRVGELSFSIRELPPKRSLVAQPQPLPPSSEAATALQQVISPDSESIASAPQTTSQVASERPANNCPAKFEECPISARITFTPEGKVKRFTGFGKAISLGYEAWVREAESRPEQLTDSEISKQLIAKGAKYPPSAIEELRQELPLTVLNKLTTCELNQRSLVFEGYRQIAREYSGGQFVPNKARILWQVFGKRTDRAQRGETCWAEFEPFEGHLFAIW